MDEISTAPSLLAAAPAASPLLSVERVVKDYQTDGESVRAGADAGNVRVKGTIVAHGRGEKTLVFKFKRKKQYKRTIGHRQNFTRVTVSDILV